MLRVFFAIPIPLEVEPQLSTLLARWRERLGDRISWIEPIYWHVTIRFLGAIEAETLATIAEVADRTTRDIAPFQLSVYKITHFPHVNSRIVAAYVRPHEALSKLASSLSAVTQKLGVNVDTRRFRPHITLGKFYAEKTRLTPVRCDDFQLTASKLVLYESHPANKASKYVALQEFPFIKS